MEVPLQSLAGMEKEPQCQERLWPWGEGGFNYMFVCVLSEGHPAQRSQKEEQPLKHGGIFSARILVLGQGKESFTAALENVSAETRTLSPTTPRCWAHLHPQELRVRPLLPLALHRAVITLRAAPSAAKGRSLLLPFAL